MELQTISQVSKQFSISTRTLRYYEQIGLITPAKKEDFAYRVYDMEAITRLRQIIILRKLRISLRQIAEILQNADVCVAIDIFERNLAGIEDEITALSTIRSVVKAFIEHLNLGSAIFALPDDEGLLEIVDSLTVSKINFKEEKSMEQLNQASEKLSKMEDKDVRIVYLPPMTVAAAYASGEDCEGKTFDMINQRLLKEWVGASDKYDNDWDSPRWTSPETSAGQGFEETLNFCNYTQNGKMKDLQLDLLFPIKEKENGRL